MDLNLRANSLESNFADALSKLLMDTGLKRIDISCNMIKKKDGDSLLASLNQNKNIIFFDIRNNELGDKDLEDAIHDTAMTNYLNS